MAAKIIPAFYGEIKNGHLSLEHPHRWKTYLKAVSGRVMLVLKRPTKPRSTSENNYYWGVVIQMIADETGMTPEEAHEAMKWQFLRKQINTIFTVKSTAILNTQEFEEYIENIRRFSQNEINLRIPLPNEINYE